MGRTTVGETIPPPLRALGGWSDAEWFCPAVLSDEEVVGVVLPKFAGGRKQTFQLDERLASTGPVPKVAKPSAQPPTGIGALLDDAGASKAAAFRRVGLLFDSAAILYFAALPLTRLKIRVANKLRLALIEIGYRGCILHMERSAAIAMFWPAKETEITAFIDAADPPYPLHLDFDAADSRRRLKRTAGSGLLGAIVNQGDGPDRAAAADQERQRLARANAALLQKVDGLRAEIEALRQSQTALGAMESLGLDDRRLKSMLLLLHPDRHGNSMAATEASQWINNLRDLLKKGS